MRISYSLTALANAISTILIAGGLNVTKWLGTAVATPNTAGVPLVDTHYHRGTAENVVIAGRRDVNIGAVQTGAITADAIAADAIGASEFAQGAADKAWSTAARVLTTGGAAGAVIRSIQKVTGGNNSVAVAITAVTTAKCVVIPINGTLDYTFNSTTEIQLTATATTGNGAVIVEFY